MSTSALPVVAEVRGLKVHFPVRQGRRRLIARAVDGVDLSLHERETVALVGESGCGKTTIARTVMRLEKPTEGGVFVQGSDITRLGGSKLRRMRREFQMVFQDPFESLSPNRTALDIVAEGLRVHRRDLDAAARRQVALAALTACGLTPAEQIAERRVFQLSGGQRQRLAIASALVLRPRLVVADEPVSMLDVSLRAEVIRALLELRDQTGTATLFITHDLALASVVADRVVVLYLGGVVEEGPAAEVISTPQHPYTSALVEVMPTAQATRRPRVILTGEAPNPTNVAPGCRFSPRCPRFRELGRPDVCLTQRPELTLVPGSEVRRIACHFPGRIEIQSTQGETQ
jgi:oligopeptide/dipeptide ABC transporter ATP-binding protein